MWKMFMFTIVWKSVTATLRSSGFSKNRGSSVKEFLCFGTHENLSSPLDSDNAWNTLVWQLGMFWVGMDICLRNCLIKEKEGKREKHFNMIILHCQIPQLFHHWTLQCSLHTVWESVDILQHKETRICCLTIFVYSNVLQWSIWAESWLKWCFHFLRAVKSQGSALDSAVLKLCKVAYITTWFSFAPPEILHIEVWH